MTRAPTDRSHLSIGEVLSLLREEFPDVTISKIRFLEAQGLLDPERTPSGYRKFYETDVERLRYILRQQKEHYLPLKVIKDRLDETGPIRTAPTAAGPASVDDVPTPASGPTVIADASGPGRRNGLAAVALDDRPAGESADTTDVAATTGSDTPGPRLTARSAAAQPGAEPVARPPRTDVAEVIEPPRPSRPARSRDDDATLQLSTGRSARAEATEGPQVSLTAEELAQASGLSPRAVRELEGYGLLETHLVGDTSYYDADALVIARTAAGFLEHGIEARHIRSYKVAADREAALYEQIVLPLLKQRNPNARRRADQTVAELVRLGDEMRGVLLRRGLRDHIPPR
ncbi:MAG TPA: MerR family transcriptional regulator [Acidimicrobiales bacterium]|nr:MerR family transcriptional regulator [Acidimicrobiales bacterium]